LLGKPLRRLSKSNLISSVPFALVDTQPGAGNNALPIGSNVAIVIDHHSLQEATQFAVFVEVRTDVGATSTILTEYLKSAGIDPSPLLATALFYGIKTDTRGLGSTHTCSADVAAYSYLQSRLDVDLLAKIEQAQVPPNYFKSFDAALRSARIYDNVVICYLGSMDYPDLTAEIADLLLRLEKSQWVICMGYYDVELILSVRARSRRSSAIKLIQSIIVGEGRCGGHGTVAGSQIILNDQDPEQLANILRQRVLKYLDIPAKSIGQPLV
jgi:nanoRNase/pAp phosphatase (c-di-AMP/oligoRNAs hydrolase)